MNFIIIIQKNFNSHKHIKKKRGRYGIKINKLFFEHQCMYLLTTFNNAFGKLTDDQMKEEKEDSTKDPNRFIHPEENELNTKEKNNNYLLAYLLQKFVAYYQQNQKKNRFQGIIFTIVQKTCEA